MGFFKTFAQSLFISSIKNFLKYGKQEVVQKPLLGLFKSAEMLGAQESHREAYINIR
jgi:hypothetical protein